MKSDGSIDLRRIAAAVSHPGIDPRSFVSLAIVTKISVEENGVICDVTLMPSQLQEAASLSPLYGGSGFGFYTPLEEGQMVVVVAPEGDPNHGLRIVACVWDQGEPPPTEVTDNPLDVALVIKKDRTMRIVVDGAGNLVVEAKGTGQVLLGSEDATQGVARNGDSVSITIASGAIVVTGSAATQSNPDPIVVTGTITSASSVVLSK